MSITINTIATEPNARNKSPLALRFSAASSSLAPTRPAERNSRAFATGFRYSKNDRTTATVATTHNTIAPMIQPSHG